MSLDSKQLREKGVVEKRASCWDIIDFGADTVAPPIRWDVVGQVRLVLKRAAGNRPAV